MHAWQLCAIAVLVVRQVSGSLMTTLNRYWQESMASEVYGDPHFSAKWGFKLSIEESVISTFEFDSGLVYSSREDAETAADHAAHVAWAYLGFRWPEGIEA